MRITRRFTLISLSAIVSQNRLNPIMQVRRALPAYDSVSVFTTMSSAKRKLVISRPPMLTLLSNVSHMTLSRKMLKRVGESRHPCRTPSVVLNHSPVLPLNRTALWALSYRFSMAHMNMMLALMLYCLIVVHKASCHTLSKAFLKSMKTW